MARNKIRKQVRLGDIYRFIVTDKLTPVTGIQSLYFSDGRLVVEYDFDCRMYDCSGENGVFDETGLREAIKQINKYITEVH